MTASLLPLFRPSRVAVVGASSNPDKMGYQIFRNIREAGFAGVRTRGLTGGIATIYLGTKL